MTRTLPLLRRLVLALGITLAGTAASAPSTAETETYRAFGEKPGLVRLMDDFMQRLLADERTAAFFREVNQAHVKRELVEQFCALLAGPCRYEGVDMKTIHQDLAIRKREFNALVELLQQAMAAQGVPFAAQNRLLARLAPMHRDIITAH
ncbi:MAG: group 1 truncated hemoglobin [Burkholderiales bacterium]|nr:group 1 truncated hemoglobin [Burkholderiales bacterium]